MSNTRVVLTEAQKRTLAIARIAQACGVVLNPALAKLEDSEVINFIADCVERGDARAFSTCHSE